MQSTVTWHKYPDEIPPVEGYYLVFIGNDMEFARFESDKKGRNPRWEFSDSSLLIDPVSYWSFMPSPPLID